MTLTSCSLKTLMRRFSWASTGILFLLVLQAPLFGFQNAKNQLDRAAHFMDDSTFGYVYLDLNGEGLVKFCDQLSVGLPSQQKQIATEIRSAAQKLNEAGASDVLITINWSRKGQTELRTILLLDEKADEKEIKSVIREHAFLFPDGKVFLETDQTKKAKTELDGMNGFKAAFESRNGAPVFATIAPSPLQRKALAQIAPKSFGANAEKKFGSIEDLLWTCLSIDPNSKDRAVQGKVKLKDEQAVQSFARRFSELTSALESKKELREAFPELHQLLNKTKVNWTVDAATFQILDSLQGDQGSEIIASVGNYLEKTRTQRRLKNLSEVVIGTHTYHDANGKFPGYASLDKDGKPLLSWRVLILPYIGESKLYQQFKLDEPWDSEHNQALISSIPAAYRAGNLKLELGKTTVQTLRGEKAGIKTGMSSKGTTIGDFRDGTSNTIFVVESSPERAVVWTQPADFEIDKDDPTKGLVSENGNAFFAARADSFAEQVPVSTRKKLLIGLFGRDDGIFEFAPAEQKGDSNSNPTLPSFWFLDLLMNKNQ